MKRSDFHYQLPDRLIAQYPLAERSASRLLQLERASGRIRDGVFIDIRRRLRPGDLLVRNDTRVIPARLHGRKATGGKVEILLERLLQADRALVQIRASKSPAPGSRIILQDGLELQVQGRERAFYVVTADNIMSLFERCGHMPLPPYIQRADEALDQSRYQTVYARRPGAVAAPTAGLHFDQSLVQQLEDDGVGFAQVTLHVGAGTFQPLRVDDIRQHSMHSEWISVPEATVAAILETKARGGRVVCIGTTSLRSLESAAQSGEIKAINGDTRLFIYPGYEFKVADGLITNFHLPESTLLMLVSAFAGHAETLAAYRHAVAAEYRFFSYGDAMLII